MDTKNTKEVLVAVNELALVIVELLKDGAQAEDAFALATKLVTDERFKKIMLDAKNDVHLVDDEVKDIDWLEAFDIAKMEFQFAMKLKEVLKK